jgi:hypothetical protein
MYVVQNNLEGFEIAVDITDQSAAQREEPPTKMAGDRTSTPQPRREGPMDDARQSIYHKSALAGGSSRKAESIVV